MDLREDGGALVDGLRDCGGCGGEDVELVVG